MNEDHAWNEIITREFYRGMRNGAVMGIVVGLLLAWLVGA